MLNLGAAAAQKQAAAETQNGMYLNAQGKAAAHTEYRVVCVGTQQRAGHLGLSVLLSTKMSPV